jgi:hypothetical protein
VSEQNSTDRVRRYDEIAGQTEERNANGSRGWKRSCSCSVL